jgi:crotonobetaine/carnitine-CoA ligase
MTSPSAAAGHSDPRVPARERCVLHYILDDLADRQPDRTYVVFEDGEEWSCRQLAERVRAVAAGLQREGVGLGEPVAVWLPNGRASLVAFYAINYLGAVFVPLNTAYRGAVLAHVLGNAGARLLIAHAGLVERLQEGSIGALETLVVVGDGPASPILRTLPFETLGAGEARPAPPPRPIEPWDNQAIIYTSGTTGPSKGVLSSYLHLYSNAGPESWPFITGDDRFLVNMPIFHMGGMGIPFVMLARGGSIALMETYSTDRFWDFVRATDCTAMFLLGVMATFLMKAPATPLDRDHRVKKAFMVPFTEIATPFRTRFGVDIYTIFNMTEVSSPIVSGPNPDRAGTCGTVRPGVDVRLVDGNDCEVPVGAVGEMIVRTDRPWGMNSGYHGNPEATAAAWRNGWFHTGDAFRRDADGHYYFVDRVKDAIRRRGENISSFEVERELLAHPDIREAAAIGVPSDYSEDEVMAVIAPMPGRAIDFAALTAFLAGRMSHFMVPRYFRLLEELPKTATAKVQKVELRREGVTADTWDRETAGIRIGRDRL